MSRPLFLLLLGLAALAPTAAVAAPVVQAGGGQLVIEPRHDLLGALGLRLGGAGAKAREFTLELQTDLPLQVELADGGPTDLLAGRLAVPGLVLLRADGGRSPRLALVPAQDQPLGMDLVDTQGGVWLQIRQAMRAPGLADGIRLQTADLRVGPALSAWTHTDSVGLLAARIELRVPVTLRAAMAQPKSCPVPNWPTDGFDVDVRLTGMDTISSLRCRVLGSTQGCGFNAFHCDGPGGQEGEVVFVPDARLRNSDTDLTADVPWYRKFTPSQPPYGNDQHPYLVWNMYRLDADGGLAQIARSGLKHAFATANEACHPDARCSFNGNILGRACMDLYNALSNDTTGALAPRGEIIPATGQWGRCGSVFDDVVNDGTNTPGCDGQNDAAPPDDCYRYRMVARESAIDPAVHPGARWFIEAWYLIRDDVDIFNGMGWREIFPTWRGDLSPARWTPGAPGPFTQGSILEYWNNAVLPPTQSSRALAETANGTVELVTQVHSMTGGYRYSYAVMNRDWSRAVTGGEEPNLEILSQRGFSSIGLSVGGHSAATGVTAEDPARTEGDWIPRTGCGGPSILAAPEAAELQWGELMRFEVFSPHPPLAGELLLQPGDGSPQIAIATSVPDAGVIFCDAFG